MKILGWFRNRAYWNKQLRRQDEIIGRLNSQVNLFTKEWHRSSREIVHLNVALRRANRKIRAQHEALKKKNGTQPG